MRGITYYHTESPDKVFYGAGVYEPNAQTDLAIDFLERAVQRPEPFALFVSWGLPHDPWVPDNVPAQFWELFKDQWRALRDKRYTYAIYRVDGKELLFDNQTDPYQQQNLVADPMHASVLEAFRSTLRQKMTALHDSFAACTWNRDHWTDGRRKIVRSATADFGM